MIIGRSTRDDNSKTELIDSMNIRKKEYPRVRGGERENERKKKREKFSFFSLLTGSAVINFGCTDNYEQSYENENGSPHRRGESVYVDEKRKKREKRLNVSCSRN